MDESTSLCVVKIAQSSESRAEVIAEHLDQIIEGDSVDFNDENVARMTDMVRIRKIYKLPTRTREKGTHHPTKFTKGVEVSDDEVIVLGLMALRGAS